MRKSGWAVRSGSTYAAKSKRESVTRGWPSRHGQISHRSPLSGRFRHIEARKQVVHWKCDTVMGVRHQGTFVTMVGRKREPCDDCQSGS